MVCKVPEEDPEPVVVQPSNPCDQFGSMVCKVPEEDVPWPPLGEPCDALVAASGDTSCTVRVEPPDAPEDPCASAGQAVELTCQVELDAPPVVVDAPDLCSAADAADLGCKVPEVDADPVVVEGLDPCFLKVEPLDRCTVDPDPIVVEDPSVGPLPGLCGWTQCASDDPDEGTDAIVSDFELAVPDLVDSVSAMLGVRFGGVWLADGANAPVLHVAVVAPTPTDLIKLWTLAPDGVAIAIVPARYSESELIGFAETATSLLQDPESDGVASVGPRYEINKLVVEIDAKGAPAMTRIVQRVPADALLIEMTTDSAVSLDSRSTYPPYKGGRRILDTTVRHFGGYCTSGFTMVISSGPNAGLSQGSTAGHCSFNNSQIKAGPDFSQRVGITNTNAFFWNRRDAYADAALIGFHDQGHATSRIYIHSSLSRVVSKKFRYARNIVKGLSLWKTGARSGTTNGRVARAYPQTLRSTYTDPSTGENRQKYVHNLVCSDDGQARRGDSGAPFYQPLNGPYARAAGITSLGIYNFGRWVATCFTPVSIVESWTDTQVKLN
jgi:hypothetical protein